MRGHHRSGFLPDLSADFQQRGHQCQSTLRPIDIAPEKLSDVIGKIYDSAVDPALWPVALEAACGLIGATLGYIGLFDTRKKTLSVPFYSGGSAEMIRNYETLVPVSPFWDVMPQYQVGQIAFTSELIEKAGVTEADVMNTRFFREWAQPSGLRDVVAGVFINWEGRIGSLNLHTPPTRDVVGPRDLAIMELLLPHARRAITISDLLDMRAIAAAAFEATLNTFSCAVVLVDANGNIVHSNQSAQTMFSAGGPIVSQRGALSAHEANATAALKDAIGRAAMNETELGYGGIGVPIRNRNDEASPAHSIAHVLPLKSGTLRPGLSLGAVAAVFVTPALINPPPPFEALAALYDLTPAEARVMIEIASGKTRAAAALALGIADSTAKTHLARVFAKTGTSEQSKLAKLVAGLTPPARPHTDHR
jgi:DNA-binding CsgD family transcriptional regulator